MRRLACCAAALALACGEPAKTPSGPLDRIHRPTGLAVHAGKLLVASSNGDLLYDDATGGSVIALDPASLDSVRVAGAVNVRSFAGDLAVARADAQVPADPDPSFCGTKIPEARAIFATRGSNTLNALRVGPDGALSCDGKCGIALPGPQSDPLAVAIACGPPESSRASAFVGYLRAPDGVAWVSEYDLATDTLLRSVQVGFGPVRGFAYDPARDRLYLVGVATSSPTPLRWVELGGCTFGLPSEAGGCTVRSASITAFPLGVELRSIALAHPFAGAPQRAFLTGRLYDLNSAAVAGGRTTDLGGRLLVVDLVDNAQGGLDVRLAREPIDIGSGAQDVRVLPRRAGLRDVVAALAIDSGVLTVYDDETGGIRQLGRSEATGVPLLGHQPFGLAVDPDAVGTARLWVGSFGESYVTPIDVPLAAPENADFAGGSQRKITGGTP